MYGTERPNIFKEMLPKESWPNQEEEVNEEKIRRAYLKMKKTATARENVASRETQTGNQNYLRNFS
jgi:hypothetical protein